MFEPGSFEWARGDGRLSESSVEKKRREDRRRFNEERRKKFFACAFPTLRECAGGMLVILCCYFVVRPLFQLMYLSAEAHRELEEMRRANKVRVAAVPTAVAATPVTEETARAFFNVNCDFSRVDVLALGNFKYINPAIENGSFPIGDGVGEKRLIGDFVSGLGYCRNTAEAQEKLAEELKKRGPGWRAMTIREFSVFAGAHPELCKDKWIGILGSVGKDADRRQCVAYFRGTDGSWNLYLSLVKLDWSGAWVFAVSRE